MTTRSVGVSLRVLWTAGVIAGLAQSVAGSAGALLARELGGSDSVAGLPQTALVVGSAASALGLSALGRSRGRRVSLSSGATVAALGCAVVAVAAGAGSLALVCVGTLLSGAGTTAVMLSRYAAADLVDEPGRARAMAGVLTAVTVGAVAGPNLLAPAAHVADDLGLTPLAGPYVVGGVLFAVTATLLAGGLGDDRPTEPPPRVRAVPLGRQAVLGLATLTVANLVMVAVMTMAPVQMHHGGQSLAVIGLVVSLHIAGMFAPSPVTGRLVSRYGARAVAVAAGVVLTVACVLAAFDAGPTLLAVAMITLGVGWNLALLSGSTLLTEGAPREERMRREGWGEVGMGVAAAGGGAAAGPTMAWGGYGALAAVGAAWSFLLIPVALRSTRRRTDAAEPVPEEMT